MTSYGFPCAKYSTIIVFDSLEEMEGTVAANPGMEIIMGYGGHFLNPLPCVFIAGLMKGGEINGKG